MITHISNIFIIKNFTCEEVFAYNYSQFIHVIFNSLFYLSFNYFTFYLFVNDTFNPNENV